MMIGRSLRRMRRLRRLGVRRRSADLYCAAGQRGVRDAGAQADYLHICHIASNINGIKAIIEIRKTVLALWIISMSSSFLASFNAAFNMPVPGLQ